MHGRNLPLRGRDDGRSGGRRGRSSPVERILGGLDLRTIGLRWTRLGETRIRTFLGVGIGNSALHERNLNARRKLGGRTSHIDRSRILEVPRQKARIDVGLVDGRNWPRPREKRARKIESRLRNFRRNVRQGGRRNLGIAPQLGRHDPGGNWARDRVLD